MIDENFVSVKFLSISKDSRILFLDTLRFVAASAVVMQHTLELEGDWGRAIAGFLSPGVFGVVLFFIISGFVIPMTSKKSFILRSFVIKRMFRIYPLLLTTFLMLALVGYSGIFPSFDYIEEAKLFDWIYNILLAQDYVGAAPLWGVTWTLSLEVVWYVIFASSLVLIGVQFDAWLSIIAPTALFSLILLSLLVGYRLPLGRLDMIYAAILGCRIYRSHIGAISQHRVILDLIIFFCVTIIGNVVSFGYFTHPTITLNQAMYPWISAPVVFSVFAMIPAARNLYVVNSRLLVWLGSISFSTYLLHPFAIGIAEYSFPTEWLILTSFVLTLIFSIFGYYLIELPGQKLGHWIDGLQYRRRQMS